jgi:hypothetical protein
MKRKEFLKIGLFGVGLGAIQLLTSRCSSSPSSPSNPGDEKAFSSSTTLSHSHNVTLLKAEVDSPPASGISHSTTASSGHSHTVIMTQDQLLACKNGDTVAVDTTTVNDHHHTFQIVKWF